MIDTARVAYFCMEYGLHESLPIFSGGLGVLAGDTMKAAHQQGRPFVGIGILWSEGYTVQRIDEHGNPYDAYPPTPREHLTLLDVQVSVRIASEEIALSVYEVTAFHNATLYLLEPAAEEHRWLTRRLYAGGASERVAQELILGVGGVRLLRALGLEADVYHFNEGHALFAGFELLREEITLGADFAEAVRRCRQRVVFTTHTPVVAGNEAHPVDLLMEQGAGLGCLTRAQLVGLGGDPFQMTVGALRLAGVANAVARLHSETARDMWAHVEAAAPILSITNGVHLGTWQDPRLRAIANADSGDEELWSVRRSMKSELLKLVEERTGAVLPVDGLLIGFARRAATYKRATLILRDLEWLEPHIREGRLQIVFAGKAHPQDVAGKEVVSELVAMARRYPNAIVFLENYDMELGRILTRGCDVWLNTPLRPMEASGTSGMKAAANGILNVSVLDGWWDEGCDHGVNGWQFGDGFEGEGADEHDLRALQEVLESEVLPTYYERPETWAQMMRAAINTASEAFSAARMLDEYYEKMYHTLDIPGHRDERLAG